MKRGYRKIEKSHNQGTNASFEERMLKRRYHISVLYMEGKSLEEISKALRISVKVVREELSLMGVHDSTDRNRGIEILSGKNYEKKINSMNSSRKSNHEIEERRKKVVRLYKEGKNKDEISKELGVSVSTIDKDIKYLIAKGLIEDQETKKKTIQDRREKVLVLYNQGNTLIKIAEELGVSINTVYKDVGFLRETGRIKGKVNKREEKVNIRRERVAKLYKEGKTEKEIAEILGISFNTVQKDITYLIKNGIIEPKITIRRKKVARLYEEGKNKVEISKELGVSVSTVNKDIKYLIENGFIEDQETKKKTIQDRREKVLVLYNQGNTVIKIAEELGVSTNTVYKDVRFLKETGRIKGKEDREDRKNKKQKVNKREEKANTRRERIAILYNRGESVRQISEDLGVPISTVYDDIKYLGENGIIRLRVKDNELKAKKRREEVARLYNSGKSIKEIAEELGVTIPTVSRDIKQLEEEGSIERRSRKSKGVENRIVERRKKVAKLYNSGKKLKDIAEELGISTSTLHMDLRYLETEGIIPTKENKSKTMSEGYSKQDVGSDLTATTNVENDGQVQKKYYSMMIKSIKSFYKIGDIENAIKYLEMSRSKMHFNEEEEKKLDEIMRILQGKKRKKEIIQEYREDEER